MQQLRHVSTWSKRDQGKEQNVMGHEHNIICQSCGKPVKKTGETSRMVYFTCPCGKKKYNRSKGL
jgi:ribosomal protein S26